MPYIIGFWKFDMPKIRSLYAINKKKKGGGGLMKMSSKCHSHWLWPKGIDHFCVKKVGGGGSGYWLLQYLSPSYWEPATKVREVYLPAFPSLITWKPAAMQK